MNNVFNSLPNYHVILNIMSCDLGGHDHTPESSFGKYKSQRLQVYIDIDLSLIAIVIYINTTSTTTSTVTQ